MVQGPSILCGSLLTDPLWIAVKEERGEVLSASICSVLFLSGCRIREPLNAFEFHTEVWATTFFGRD